MRLTRQIEITGSKVVQGPIDLNTGRYPDPVKEPFTMSGSFQPVLGEDLKAMPEGYREFDSHVIFSHTEIPKKSEIHHDNRTFIVFHREAWLPGAAPNPHYRYIIIEEVALK